MEELRKALDELYLTFGHNDINIALSKILEEYIVQVQRKELVNHVNSRTINI